MLRTAGKLLLPLLSIAVLMGLSASWNARAGGLDTDQQVKILMRVLTYDRNLEKHADGDKIFVVVLYKEGDAGSIKEKDSILTAFEAVAGVKVKGKTLSFEPVAFESREQLEAFLSQKKANAVYVCSGLGSVVPDIRSAARSAKTATLTGSEKLLKRGLAVAVVERDERDGKGRIIVDLEESKRVGMSLDSALLRLAEVIR